MSELEERVAHLEGLLASATQRIETLENRGRSPAGALAGGKVVYDPALLAGGQLGAARLADPYDS